MARYEKKDFTDSPTSAVATTFIMHAIWPRPTFRLNKSSTFVFAHWRVTCWPHPQTTSANHYGEDVRRAPDG